MSRTMVWGVMFVLSPAAALAADNDCDGSSNVAEFRYSWCIRGAIRFLAGLMFPTAGVGNLKTTYPKEGEHSISSKLLITRSNGEAGLYPYESQMDEAGRKPLMTYSCYSCGYKNRKVLALFVSFNHLARIPKVPPKGTK